jgi:hypothetical protein
MNRKGQTIITVIFIMGVFWIVWIFFIGKFVNVIVEDAITAGSITGLGALILTNLNVLIGLCSLLALFWAARSMQ